MQLTKEKYNEVKIFEATEKFGFLSPNNIECVYFSICCEEGTENGCEFCKRKRYISKTK